MLPYATTMLRPMLATRVPQMGCRHEQTQHCILVHSILASLGLANWSTPDLRDMAREMDAKNAAGSCGAVTSGRACVQGRSAGGGVPARRELEQEDGES